MDKKTLSYYSKEAARVFDLYLSACGGVSVFFEKAFPRKMRLLDIGAGSGRDMLELLKRGHDVYGVEPCEELRKLALERFPVLEGRLAGGALPFSEKPFGKSFEGVLCAAVLMHLERSELEPSIKSMMDILENGGRLLVSIPLSRRGSGADSRDEHGRLFESISPFRLESLFMKAGGKLIERYINEDALGRKGLVWSTHIFEKS